MAGLVAKPRARKNQSSHVFEVQETVSPEELDCTHGTEVYDVPAASTR